MWFLVRHFQPEIFNFALNTEVISIPSIVSQLIKYLCYCIMFSLLECECDIKTIRNKFDIFNPFDLISLFSVDMPNLLNNVATTLKRLNEKKYN